MKAKENSYPGKGVSPREKISQRVIAKAQTSEEVEKFMSTRASIDNHLQGTRTYFE